MLYNKGGILRKRNCLEIAPRALLLAVAVILTVLIVSLMVSQFKSAQEMSNASMEVISRRTDEIRNNEITQYDGLTVSGADVVNFLKRNLMDAVGGDESDLKITLKGGSGNSRTYRTYEAAVGLSDMDDDEYVNPVTKWKCSVIRNKNGIITEVIFKRK